jgi:hypothetical protein
MLGGPRIREPRIVQEIIVPLAQAADCSVVVTPTTHRRSWLKFNATLALMRTFIVSFDVSVLAMWLPCAFLLCVCRVKEGREKGRSG